MAKKRGKRGPNPVKLAESVERGMLDCDAGMLSPLSLGMKPDEVEEQFAAVHYAYNALEAALRHVRFLAASALIVTDENRTEWAAVYHTAGAALQAARLRRRGDATRGDSNG